MISEGGMSLYVWEAGWAESSTAFAAGIVIAAVLTVIIVLVMRGRSSKNNVKESV